MANEMQAEQIDGRAAFAELLAEAEALPQEQVKRPSRFDATLANNNIRIGIKVAYRHQAEIPRVLPDIHVPGLLALPRLGAAVIYADLEAERTTPSDSTVSKMLREASSMRTPMLGTLKVLVNLGLIPAEEHKRIITGKGARDRGQDCLELSRVFVKYADVIAGKHPITPEMIDRAAVVGTWVLQHVNAPGARADTQAIPHVVHVRHRMITLLVNRYQDLRRVGYYFYGDDFNKHVPKLQSRYVRPRKPAGGASGDQE